MEAVSEADQNEMNADGKAILLVDDDLGIREMVAFYLLELGYRVQVAGTGDEACRVMDEHKDIELMITDVKLPGGMDGYALAREMRNRVPDLKVLYASGSFAREGGEGPPAHERLAKPFRLHQLREQVEGLIGT